ncbi:hypothetical protein LDENG_00228510 [Lucifuga dentata]|nr:hypothetical protein LDENG_00228510 [Lucifuga dentata]
MTEVSQRRWGEVSGQGSVHLWVLQSSQVRVEILTLGAIIRSVCSRGKDGRMEDLVLGFDDLEGYLADKKYMGALVGRVANRIAKGHFVVEGLEYQLDINNGPNAIHGGLRGFSKVSCCRRHGGGVMPRQAAPQVHGLFTSFHTD